jgi:hypothetical protein
MNAKLTESWRSCWRHICTSCFASMLLCLLWESKMPLSSSKDKFMPCWKHCALWKSSRIDATFFACAFVFQQFLFGNKTSDFWYWMHGCFGLDFSQNKMLKWCVENAEIKFHWLQIWNLDSIEATSRNPILQIIQAHSIPANNQWFFEFSFTRVALNSRTASHMQQELQARAKEAFTNAREHFEGNTVFLDDVMSEVIATSIGPHQLIEWGAVEVRELRTKGGRSGSGRFCDSNKISFFVGAFLSVEHVQCIHHTILKHPTFSCRKSPASCACCNLQRITSHCQFSLHINQRTQVTTIPHWSIYRQSTCSNHCLLCFVRWSGWHQIYTGRYGVRVWKQKNYRVEFFNVLFYFILFLTLFLSLCDDWLLVFSFDLYTHSAFASQIKEILNHQPIVRDILVEVEIFPINFVAPLPEFFTIPACAHTFPTRQWVTHQNIIIPFRFAQLNTGMIGHWLEFCFWLFFFQRCCVDWIFMGELSIPACLIKPRNQ